MFINVAVMLFVQQNITIWSLRLYESKNSVSALLLDPNLEQDNLLTFWLETFA